MKQNIPNTCIVSQTVLYYAKQVFMQINNKPVNNNFRLMQILQFGNIYLMLNKGIVKTLHVMIFGSLLTHQRILLLKAVSTC